MNQEPQNKKFSIDWEKVVEIILRIISFGIRQSRRHQPSPISRRNNDGK